MSLGSALKTAFLGHRSCASTIGRGPDGKGLPARVYQADYEIVFAGAIKAIEDLGWQVVCASRTRGDLDVQRPWGLTTWGDNICITLQRIDNSRIRVDASSYTAGELYDWGRHARNVRHYLVDLDNRIGLSHSPNSRRTTSAELS